MTISSVLERETVAPAALLGKNCINSYIPGQSVGPTDLDRQRWLWDNSSLPGPRHCERCPHGETVTPYWSPGVLTFGGLLHCGSVHVCVICARRIRAARAAELSRGMLALVRRGGSVVPLTLTERHWKGLSLREARRTIRRAWDAVCHDRVVKALRAKFEWEYVCPFEVTHGVNGWHAHLQACLGMPEAVSQADLAEIELAIFNAWSKALARIDERLTPDFEHGIAMEVAGDLSQVSKIGHYVSKIEGLGHEIARGDRKLSNGGEHPFEIQARAYYGDPEALKLWREYEQATKGLRAMNYSKGWWDLLRIDPVSDEVAADDVRQGPQVALDPLSLRQWSWVVRHPRGRELFLDVLDLTNGDRDAGIRAVLASLPASCVPLGDPDLPWLKGRDVRALKRNDAEMLLHLCGTQGELFAEEVF